MDEILFGGTVSDSSAIIEKEFQSYIQEDRSDNINLNYGRNSSCAYAHARFVLSKLLRRSFLVVPHHAGKAQYLKPQDVLSIQPMI